MYINFFLSLHSYPASSMIVGTMCYISSNIFIIRCMIVGSLYNIFDRLRLIICAPMTVQRASCRNTFIVALSNLL